MPSVENVATLKIQLASETERCSKATPLKTLLAGYGHLPSPISLPPIHPTGPKSRGSTPRPARAAPVRWRAQRSHWYIARVASCQRIARPFSVMRRFSRVRKNQFLNETSFHTLRLNWLPSFSSPPLGEITERESRLRKPFFRSLLDPPD